MAVATGHSVPGEASLLILNNKVATHYIYSHICMDQIKDPADR